MPLILSLLACPALSIPNYPPTTTLKLVSLFTFQLFIGFGFPYEGPAPLEAIANGCIFLQPKFQPPHSSLNHEFFRGKPTSREVSPLRAHVRMVRVPAATRSLCLYAGVLAAPVRRTAYRQTACHDGGLQQLPRVRVRHQGNPEDKGTFTHHAFWTFLENSSFLPLVSLLCFSQGSSTEVDSTGSRKMRPCCYSGKDGERAAHERKRAVSSYIL